MSSVNAQNLHEYQALETPLEVRRWAPFPGAGSCFASPPRPHPSTSLSGSASCLCAPHVPQGPVLTAGAPRHPSAPCARRVQRETVLTTDALPLPLPGADPTAAPGFARFTPDLGNEVSSRICWCLRGEEPRLERPIKTNLTFSLAKHILVRMMSLLSMGLGALGGKPLPVTCLSRDPQPHSRYEAILPTAEPR